MKSLWLGLFFGLAMIRPGVVCGVNYELTFQGLSQKMGADEVVELRVNFSGNSSYANKTYFLRAVMAEAESTAYFGLTQNNVGEWVGSESDRSLYYAITTNEMASYSGVLKFMVDVETAQSKGPGRYDFKVGRYTSAADSTADWTETEEVELEVVMPTPTPTPTPTATPTATPEPTANPTSTPKATATFLPKTGNSDESMVFESFEEMADWEGYEATDSGIVDMASRSGEVLAAASEGARSKNPKLGKLAPVAIIGGGLATTGGGMWLWLSWREEKEKASAWEEEE